MEILTLFVTLVVGVIGGSAGAVAIRGWLDRRKTDALTKKITAEAHDLVYESYRDLITDLRRDAELARHEARDARAEAREATQRAADAESVASNASASAAKAQLALVEVRRLVVEHVPDAPDLLRQIEVLAARARA